MVDESVLKYKADKCLSILGFIGLDEVPRQTFMVTPLTPDQFAAQFAAQLAAQFAAQLAAQFAAHACMDCNPTRWPASPRIVTRRTLRVSNGPDRLGSCALQTSSQRRAGLTHPKTSPRRRAGAGGDRLRLRAGQGRHRDVGGREQVKRGAERAGPGDSGRCRWW